MLMEASVETLYSITVFKALLSPIHTILEKEHFQNDALSKKLFFSNLFESFLDFVSVFGRFCVDDQIGKNATKKYAFSYENAVVWSEP